MGCLVCRKSVGRDACSVATAAQNANHRVSQHWHFNVPNENHRCGCPKPSKSANDEVVQSDIVLFTFNARYIHSAFGLRCLLANLGELKDKASLLEVDLQCRPVDAAERILARNPRIVGVSVYIWNVTLVRELVATLKAVAPSVKVVLGGPEVSHELDRQPWTNQADCVIQGEGELAFKTVCQQWFADLTLAQRIIQATPPPPHLLASPYPHYTDEDIRSRIIYVEASRGCPYACEFCLSALDEKVRAFPLEAFLSEMRALLDRGVTTFKFVDRTFNLNLKTSQAILEFFLDNDRPNLFVHFEMIPDRFPDALRAVVARFREGVLQFEVGVQTLNPVVEKAISRRQNHAQLESNLMFLERAQVHVHADLIVGLPLETLSSFGEGFDRLKRFGPEEIQVGILKRLRGAPIDRHTESAGMRYAKEPPYEVLETAQIDFSTMQQLKRFARHWDVFANSGNFKQTLPLLWLNEASPFSAFLCFSGFLHQSLGTTTGVSLLRHMELLLTYLTTKGQAEAAKQALVLDYRAGGRHETPRFLALAQQAEPVAPTAATHNKRQRKHVAAV